MKAAQPPLVAALLSTAWVFALAFPPQAKSETSGKHNPSVLLDEAKLIDYEQRVGVKKVEMDRLNEDLKKGSEEVDAIDSRIKKAAKAIEDAAKQLEEYTVQKKRETGEMELLNLQIEAERMKGEALKLLQAANKKAQEAAVKRNEEITARTALVAAETRQLATKAPNTPAESGPGKSIASKTDLPLTEWRKKLTRAQSATSLAEIQAREAMATATARLADSENAAAKPTRKRRISSMKRIRVSKAETIRSEHARGGAGTQEAREALSHSGRAGRIPASRVTEKSFPGSPSKPSRPVSQSERAALATKTKMPFDIGHLQDYQRTPFSNRKPLSSHAYDRSYPHRESPNLGAEADIVKVKVGYARNFLIPQGKALEGPRRGASHQCAEDQARRA